MIIDAIITWVDGKEPILAAKRAEYGDKNALSRVDIGGATRYADLGEIHWCVRSLNIYAPWLHKIFIITDGQDPEVKSDIPVEIVDHSQIFKGYEEYLPVFNSLSIETLMWRIPGLSERFIYLNDDFLLTGPAVPEDFFTKEGKAVCYADKYSMPWAKLIYHLSCLKAGYERVTNKRFLYQGAELAGNTHYFYYVAHTPRATFRSICEEYYSNHQEEIIRNISCRFREARQYHIHSLLYALMERKDMLSVRRPSKYLMFICHWNGVEYLKRKFAEADRSAECKFACFNSLDKADEEERAVVIDWVSSKLRICNDLKF